MIVEVYKFGIFFDRCEDVSCMMRSWLDMDKGLEAMALFPAESIAVRKVTDPRHNPLEP